MKKASIFFLILSISFISSAQKDTKTEDKEKSNIKKVLIPTISYNNSFKTSIGVMAADFYALSANDTISPISSTTFIASYSTNDTWVAILPNKFYFNEDRFRSKLVVGTGSVNFQTYQVWGALLGGVPNEILPPQFIPQGDGVFIDYQNRFYFLFTDFMVNIYDRLYAGVNIVYSGSKTTFDVPTTPSDTQNLFGFGLASEFDTRNNQMQPLTGFNGKLNTTSFLENLGSTSNYTNINLQYNRYFKQGERNTIALRFYAQAAVGDVPFAAQNVVGRDDLRGYSNGKYRANQVYDVQTEYRHWFREKWGYVAFGGVATAINNANDISLNKTLPAVGAGIRFLAVPKARISVGVDVAAGKDDWGVYFRIGEAFGR